MKIKQVTEVIWRYYQEGRAKATAQTFLKADIMQMTKMGVNEFMLMRHNDAKKKGTDDYYFTSPLLSIQKFELTAPNAIGMRRAGMDQFDLYRLPQNAHITNVYAGGQLVTQVRPGEENYYLTAEFEFYKFFVVKGRGINVYHIHPNIKNIEVEATFNSDDIDIPMDIAFEVANVILGEQLKFKGFPTKIVDNIFDSNATEVRKRLQDQEQGQ